MFNELTIQFESFEQRGIHKNFEENDKSPFFHGIYSQAISLVTQIDKENERYISNEANYIQNVIAFIGRRGTGKTSAMLSFSDMLSSKSFSEKYNYTIKNKKFFAIPYIDASMLSENEDVFEIILSKMLSNLTNRFEKRAFMSNMDENQYQILLKDLCNVYNNYSCSGNMNNIRARDPHNFMEQLADKHNIKKNFATLVRKYTEVMYNLDGNDESRGKGYLVICIDDIDMTQQKHIKIMQCIHQYLMIPQVIVLVSFNMPMLTASLQADFFPELSIPGSTLDEHRHQMDITRSQTYDFIRKIIPADMRVTMPSWLKRDYMELYPLKIEFETYNDCEKIIKMFPKLDKGKIIRKLQCESKNKGNVYLTPKQLIMLMIADRTKIYLDARGFKLHFMQPNSLRNMNDLFYLLYNMENINIYEINEKTDDNIRKEHYKNRRANRKILLDYLHFNMLPENNFSSDIEEFINNVISAPMERRGRIIWNYYFSKLSTDEHKEHISRLYGSDFYNEQLNYYEIEKYSFGDLFRVMYSSTRLNVIDRKVIIFLLANFAFSMPQFIEIEKWKHSTRNKASEPDGYKRIREAFGYTLIGTWCKDLFNQKDVCISCDIYSISNETNLKVLIYLLMLRSSPLSSKNIHKNEVEFNIDPTSFIINSLCFNAKGSSETDIDEFIRELSKYNPSVNDKYMVLKDKIREELMPAEHTVDFLLKHTDLTYNVIKRVIAEMIYVNDNNLKPVKNEKPYLNIIKEFYHKLIEKLELQDEIYNEDSGNKFSEILQINPVVRLFIDEEEDLTAYGFQILEKKEKNENDGQVQS